MIGQSVGPFRVMQKLGAGGMGEVYLAEDTRLGRKVALKSPSASWLKDPEGRLRLQREARAAARLNNPRIAAVYDVLDLEDRPYIVMEYVEGETLASCLRRGPLTVERALEVGTELADALIAAHEGGVIHRDLKPGNIVLTSSGAIKVLDFGLAKTAHADEDSRSDLTHPGQLLGTPGYVAPEQLLGNQADARSDIYSAGAVLYQMLSGRPPFEQTDSMGRALAALMEGPRPLQQLDPSIPASVCAVVERAMAREPADRYQTAAELRAALEGSASALHDSPTHLVGVAAPPRRRIPELVQVVAAVVLLLAVAGIPISRWWKARETASVARTSTPVVAVLPFENLSGDPGLQYMGAGMAETVSTRLASVTTLSVIPRSQIREALDGTASRADRISKALGASYLVTGAIQKTGSLLQVTVSLLMPDGRTVPGSGEVFEEEAANVFALQRRIAESLSGRILGTLSDVQRQRLARAPTSSVDALSSYWRGRALLDKPSAAGALDEAIASFREATSRDPKFGLAYAGLADALWLKYGRTKNPEDAKIALAAVEEARRIAPEEPQVRLSLARSYQSTGRFDDSVRELTQLLAAQPNNDDAHRLLGDLYARQGRDADAVGEYQRAIGIRPEYWRNRASLGGFYYGRGRFADAVTEFERVAALQPDNALSYSNLGAAHHSAGDLTRAAENYRRAIAIAPTASAYSNLGAAYHLQRQYDEAIAAYGDAIRLSPHNPLYQRNLGDTYVRKGDHQRASAAYQQAIVLARESLSVNPGDVSALSLLALCQAKLSQFGEARATIAGALRRAPDDSQVLHRAAAIEARAGNRAAALDYCQRAIARGASRLMIRDDDDFETLRNDPAFVRLTNGGS